METEWNETGGKRTEWKMEWNVRNGSVVVLAEGERERVGKAIYVAV